MISSSIWKTLGINDLTPGAQGVKFSLGYPIPSWGWALIVLAITLIAWWSYRQLLGPVWPRRIMGAVRALILLVLVFIIADPRLEQASQRTENDTLVVLMDRSASMTIADVQTEDTLITRDHQLKTILQDHTQTFDSLATQHDIQWLGFAAGAFDLPPSDQPDQPIRLTPPTGQRTDFETSIRQALEQNAGKPLAGIIIFSDGQSITSLSRPTARLLQSQRLPILAVPLGSPTPLGDLSIAAARAPSAAFVHDAVPVQVQLSLAGFSDKPPAEIIVELVDAATAIVLDSQTIIPSQDPLNDQPVITLQTEPEKPGEAHWRVVVRSDQKELLDDNNSMDIRVQLADRPLRVVYFDGYPRWEYRYIKNLLLRESSIRSSALLVAPHRQYLQEGDVILDTIPRSPSEWSSIDVVVLGDLASEVLSTTQLQQIKDHVAQEGAGLLLIAGPTTAAHNWRSTPLADLLPFLPPAASQSSTQQQDIVLAPTPLAQRLGLLRLSSDKSNPWPAQLSDPATGWSRLRWSESIDPSQLKPATEILALGISADNPAASTALPIITTMRFGSGRVVHVATDEIWRWRYARGEALPERFWLPIIRYLGRDSLARLNQPVIITASPQQTLVDQVVQLTVRIMDQSLLNSMPDSIAVRITPVTQDDNDQPDDAWIAPMTIRLSRNAGDYAAVFTSTYTPSEPGTFRIQLADPSLTIQSPHPSARLIVHRPDDEMQKPQTNHAALAELANHTQEFSGQMVNPDQLDTIAALIPNRQRLIISEPRIEKLWDTPPVLILLITLLTIEWITRRLIRLA